MDAWDEGSSFQFEVEGASRVLGAVGALADKYELVLVGVRSVKGARAKLHYSMCDDAKLRDEVLRRTGYDLDDLTHDEVVAISTHLNAVLGRRGRFSCSDVADGGVEVKD